MSTTPLTYKEFLKSSKATVSMKNRYVGYVRYLVAAICSQKFTEIYLCDATADLYIQDKAIISNALMYSTSIEKIKVIDFYIAKRQWPVLNKALKYISIRHLYKNNFDELASSIHNLPSLQTLDLSYCHIEDKGVTTLAESLTYHPNLKVLNLRNNYIADDGAKSLANLLRVNTTLHRLVVTNNKITSIGANALIDAFRVNTTLTTLFGICNLVDVCDVCDELQKRNRQLQHNIKKWRSSRKNVRNGIRKKLVYETCTQQISEVLIDIVEHQQHLKTNFEAALSKAETDCCIAISELECAHLEVPNELVEFQINELERKRDALFEEFESRYSKYYRMLQQDRAAVEENVSQYLERSSHNVGYQIQCGHAGAPWIQMTVCKSKIRIVKEDLLSFLVVEEE